MLPPLRLAPEIGKFTPGFNIYKMSIGTYFGNIQSLLFTWADIIKQSNSLNRGNDAIDAENTVTVLLNTAFDWGLKNANEEKTNQKSFDLVNRTKSLMVQVTSNQRYNQKLQQTVESFRKTRHKKGCRLIIFFLSRECSALLLKKRKVDDFEYEAFDIPKLCKKIFRECKSVEKLALINQVLQNAIMPVLINPDTDGERSIISKLPKQAVPEHKSGIYINRSLLITEIFLFGQSADGLIVGGPGVGKSFVLNELQRLCAEKQVACLIVRINELADATNEEVKEALGTKGTNWIAELKRGYHRNEKEKALLVFDAFDTAKDERMKQFILQSIRKAMKELANDWSVLVTSRTFDASKSFRLMELFPHVNINRAISCRYLSVPELTETELTNAIKSNSLLTTTYDKSTTELKQLLRIPYFLKLVENVLRDTDNTEHKKLYAIETEEQLLKTYWDKRVASDTGTSLFLERLTTLLASKENLSCRRSEVTIDSTAAVYDKLISLDIIEESASIHRNITYTHNILLEYAISIYTIPERSSDLIEYVRTNPRMPFSFRQSFIYFYNRLWRFYNDLFWEHYFVIKGIDEPVFRLFHQNILNFVLGSFYSSVKQFGSVFSQSNPEERSNLLKKILEGIRFINKGQIREKDYDLLVKCAENLHVNHLWILGFQINKAIKQLQEKTDKKLWMKMTKASLLYFGFILRERDISNYKWILDNNGGLWGMQNVCATFSYNPSKAKALILNALLILKEENFPIWYFRSLAESVVALFSYDPEFGGIVYTTIYCHTENSNAVTQLGGPILGLRSNRAQDFNMIHYELEREFTPILLISPDAGLKLGIEIVNRFSNSELRMSRKMPSFSIVVNGIQAQLVSDFFFFDFEEEDDHGAFSCIKKMFDFLDDLLKNNKLDEVNRYINLLIFESKAARLWRRMMQLFVVYPNYFKQTALSLLINETIFVCDETFYDAGELIRSLWNLLTASERADVEKVIISLQSSRFLINKKELTEDRIKTLLTCIPNENIELNETRQFLTSHGLGSANKPLMKRPRLQSYTPSEEENIIRTGIVSSSKSEIRAYELIKALQPFNKLYDTNNTDNPPKQEYLPLIELVKELWDLAKSERSYSDTLISNCDYEVCRFAELVSRNKDKLSRTIRLFVESIGIYYIESNRYKAVSYDSGSIKNRAGAYTPSPRTDATLILIHFLNVDTTGKLAPIVLRLFSDNIQIVRFKAIHASSYFWHFYRDDFWKTIRERIEKETDGMCLHQLLGSVCYDNIMKEDQDNVEQIAILAYNTLTQADDDPVFDLWQTYVVVLLKLFIKYQSVVSKDILYRRGKSKAFARSMILEIMTVIDPREKSNNYSVHSGKYEDLLLIIRITLQNCFTHINEKGLESLETNEDFEIIDSCVQQLFFTTCVGKKDNRNKPVDERIKRAFYFKIKPLLQFIVDESVKIGSGFMVAHTGYYFMQLLNSVLSFDPAFVLSLSSEIVKCAAANNFTYDPSTIEEIVKLTEHLLADHKELLLRTENFTNLVIILDQFANSGSQEALELTWRLRDIF